ncbi:nascent polypeptide-associated complex protein [Picrophilus oshimae]|uniref:Nascent polypeptide-associated complex protein n=2 Tax=Picrophilus torridus (strain ATCC 700027 / DSM 9790 / JCM 10055 / NBRC 100828 / KAW 2/3) TaxID=1122961 RepID=NAC_PICTO|nr:nascent polypeptide-associated complex protein [Picrophilus oshimae]Q6L1N3.1 RecName: Full=Nascent polypeptide-associated complex protein [Picrophilus oshimae DSM 9789]AAT43119.1 nascent polypeptide-associated complex protein [Picrophilus oshimae DSM 9789]SMD30573.1 Nascent polypeptide associated complex NAC [Picrophilus oshimae DSM 9789]
MNPREIRRMMAQMGIKSTEMSDVKQVIFKGKDKDYIIDNASVTMIEAQGQKTFQVLGNLREVKKEVEQYSEDDIKLVMEQAKVTREKAIEALKAANGEPAQAILNLTS